MIELLHPRLERAPLARIVRRLVLRHRQLAAREARQGKPGVAGRHQGLVVGLDDQLAGLADTADGVYPETSGDRRKREEGKKDLAAHGIGYRLRAPDRCRHCLANSRSQAPIRFINLAGRYPIATLLNAPKLTTA